MKTKIGDLMILVGFLGLLPVKSANGPTFSAVTVFGNEIDIRIPWFCLNVVAPDYRYVFNEDRSTVKMEDTVSDGFLPCIFNKKLGFSPTKRHAWEDWNYIPEYQSMEQKKTSYFVTE